MWNSFYNPINYQFCDVDCQQCYCQMVTLSQHLQHRHIYWLSTISLFFNQHIYAETLDPWVIARCFKNCSHICVIQSAAVAVFWPDSRLVTTASDDILLNLTLNASCSLRLSTLVCTFSQYWGLNFLIEHPNISLVGAIGWWFGLLCLLIYLTEACLILGFASKRLVCESARPSMWLLNNRLLSQFHYRQHPGCQSIFGEYDVF